MKNILLAGGIPLKNYNSFFCQLNLLKRGLERFDFKVELLSPVSEFLSNFYEDSDFGKKYSVNYIDYSSNEIFDFFESLNSDAIIMLGYLDQFSFLCKDRFREINLKKYLWAQFSSPANLKLYSEDIIYVPLTETSRKFCAYGGAKNIAQVIPHGIDRTIFYPYSKTKKEELKRSFGFNNIDFIIGTVGRNILRKRFDDILNSFYLFLKRVDNGNIKLVIKTDSIFSDFGFDLERLINRYSLNGKVIIITDDFSPSRMADLYNIFDLYLHLAEWEGFGIPVVESMSCGVPVITHEGQGPSEIVDNAGLVCKSFTVKDGDINLKRADPVDVADKIFMLYDDNNLLNRLSENGRRISKDIFDINIVANKWAELLNGKNVLID